MARWVRPTWLATWVAMVYGTAVLLPSLQPVYGQRFPEWVWLGVPVQILSFLGLAVYLDDRKREGAYEWMVAGMAASGTSVVFPLGLSFLIGSPLTILDRIAIVGGGILCLVLLLFLDRIGFLAEGWAPVDSRGFRLRGGRPISESRFLFAFVLVAYIVLLATYLLV